MEGNGMLKVVIITIIIIIIIIIVKIKLILVYKTNDKDNVSDNGQQ